jgi:hypothetical protein
MNTIRILGLAKGSKANLSPWLHRFGHHLFSGRHFTLADRRAALGAEIVENFAIGQD